MTAPEERKAAHDLAVASGRYRVEVLLSQYGGKPSASFTPDAAGAWVRFACVSDLPEVQALIADAVARAWDAAFNACDPTSYAAHHAATRRRCQKAIREAQQAAIRDGHKPG